MGNKKASAKTRSNRKHQISKYDSWSKSQPNVCIISRGKVSEQLKSLEENLRNVFQPLTFVNSASFSSLKLKELPSTLQALKASHLLILSEAKQSTTLKLVKSPSGPTLTFKINNWALTKDISCIKTEADKMHKSFFTSSHPFLVTSNFSADVPHEKILSVTLQNLFPNFDIEESDLKAFKRCAIFHRDEATGDIDFRHYAIKRNEISQCDSISEIASSKLVKLSTVSDVSDFVLKSVDDQSTTQKSTATNATSSASSKFSLNLKEIGPRLKMELVKVEEGFCDGRVLYHKYIEKNPEEINQLEKKIKVKSKLKEERKAIQQANVEKKLEVKSNKKPRLLYRPAKDGDSKPRRNLALKTKKHAKAQE